MAGPATSQRRAVDGLALPPSELLRRQADQAWGLHVAVIDGLRGNPRLAGDALCLIFRAESFERYERTFSGMTS